MLIESLAPTETVAVDYDRRHLALYAALLDAADTGQDWRETAKNLMGINVDRAGAKACWQSHLERARWIVNEGLASAVVAFGHQAR